MYSAGVTRRPISVELSIPPIITSAIGEYNIASMLVLSSQTKKIATAQTAKTRQEAGPAEVGYEGMFMVCSGETVE